MARNPQDIVRALTRRGATHARPAFRHAEQVENDGAERVDVRPGHEPRTGRARRHPAREPFVARLINQWWTRLLQAIYHGSLSEQEAEYASHSTGRDYVWNTVGTALWGMTFPVFTVVATQLAGTEQAGMFSMAFVTGTLLMIAANYGVRNYQVSDIDETHSFGSYQLARWITGILAFGMGLLYCTLRGYESDMFTICMGVYVYKLIDGVADVYEGRLQQADKLYLAGISQAVRSVVVVVAFSLMLLITRNLALASIAMAVIAVASFALLTLPLALLETEKSGRWHVDEVTDLLTHCFPLFAALFLFNLIESIPKFVMEGALSYDNQLYFNAIYFPAHGLLLMSQLIYRPLLVRMAAVWADPEKRLRFDIIIVVILLVVVGLTLAMAAIMGTVGIPVLGMLYGVDFEQFRGLVYIMLAAGGLTAAIDFIYQTITILRRQMAVMKLYLITFGFSLFVPVLLVNFTGLPGAVIGYLIVMCILFMLLIWEYGKIRLQLMREDKMKAQEELVRRRHDSTKIHPIKG